MDSFSLDGKTALVTGAFGLLGREHCRALAGAGAFVVGCDSALTGQGALRDELGDRFMAVQADVTDRSSLERALSAVLTERRRLDVVVNNAALNDALEHGRQEKTDFETFSESAWRKSLDVNLTGVFLCCQVFGGRMAKQGRGSIVNIASTYGVVAPDPSLYRDESGETMHVKSPAYPATKAGVIALTKYLAAYWGSRVRVNSLSPGGVENGQPAHFIRNYSERTPMGRMALPSDYRGAVVFLASEASAYMTGANLIVDGGWTAW